MDFKVRRDDISRMEVDAVVLPANPRLLMGTGASMAIFEAAGKEQLEAECAVARREAMAQGTRLEPGVTVPTHAFDLPADIILHAIVPKWDEENQRKSYTDLCEAYSSALVCADQLECESVAFPVLASGNNRFDADLALDIALRSLRSYVPTHALSLAYLVTFDELLTQKARDKGYEVEESIGQRSVFEQGMHQAKVWEVEKGRIYRKRRVRRRKKSLPRALFDKVMKFATSPEGKKVILGLARTVAENVLPEDGAGGIVRDALDVVSQPGTSDQR